MREYFVQESNQLVDLCAQLKQQPVIALDTEFLREKTYYAKLCLIQIACPDFLACVDPLALDDMQELVDIIYDPKRVKVMHSARQDLEIFFDITGKLPASMFDTQIAATLLGYGDQIGYANLVNDMLGIKLAKLHTRTDWSKRPLDKGQIRYALDDVRYLLEIHATQSQMLSKLQRGSWLDDDFNYLSNSQLYEPDSANYWRKIKANNGLKGVQLLVLKNLAEWRETQARQTNKPRQWLLRDELLVELARRLPADEVSLEKIRGWENGRAKFSKEVLLIIAESKQAPSETWPILSKRTQLSKEQEAIVDVMMAVVRLKATQNSVTPAVLVNRKQLEKIAIGEYDCAVLQGWRKEIVGNELLALLDNKREIQIKNGQLNLEVKS